MQTKGRERDEARQKPREFVQTARSVSFPFLCQTKPSFSLQKLFAGVAIMNILWLGISYEMSHKQGMAVKGVQFTSSFML